MISAFILVVTPLLTFHIQAKNFLIETVSSNKNEDYTKAKSEVPICKDFGMPPASGCKCNKKDSIICHIPNICLTGSCRATISRNDSSVSPSLPEEDSSGSYSGSGVDSAGSAPGSGKSSSESDCFEEDTDYFRNDIVPYNQAPLLDFWWLCSDLCRNKYPTCKYWTFMGKKCLVKTSKDGKRKKKGAISGPRQLCSSFDGSADGGHESDRPENVGSRYTGSGERGSGGTLSKSEVPICKDFGMPPASGCKCNKKDSIICHIPNICLTGSCRATISRNDRSVSPSLPEEDSSGSDSGSGVDSSGSAPGSGESSSESDCFEEDTDYFRNNIVPFNQAPLLDFWWLCSDLCRNKYPTCKYWTFVGKKCLVKTSKDGKRKIKGAISGPRQLCSSFDGSADGGHESDRPENIGSRYTGSREGGSGGTL